MIRFDDEVWMPVPSKPGIVVSSLGRLKLPERVIHMPNGGFKRVSPKPTFGYVSKASKDARHEYMGYYSREYGNLKIHRLVCEAFHGEQPNGRSVVVHVDEDSKNNRADNLKWGTQKENLNMPKFIEYCKSRFGDNSPHAKSRNSESKHETD